MRTFLFLLSLFIFSFFVLFSYLVHKDYFNQLDFDTTVKVQNRIDQTLELRKGFDTSLSILSLLGSFEVITLFILLVLILKRSFKSLILIPFSFVLLHLIELSGKLFVTHTGPPFMFLRTELPFSFPSFYVQPGFSYPSGHAARTVFLSIFIFAFILRSKKISLNLKVLIIVALISFNLVMLVSRVYLGEHWTTDVIGGALLGASLATFSLIFLPSKQGGRESSAFHVS